MKKSLDYFNQHFSNYPYQQIRIMEYPRYTGFAQSFPGTVPYSEELGFILNVDDSYDVDIPFYVTAHELAHQWWGLQLVAANVKGKHMILETLAQYSALMVLKHDYPKEKAHQFLKDQMDRYLKARKQTSKREVPLELVTDESYIYYNKGVLNLSALQDYISEDSVNVALNRFLQDWNSISESWNKDRFPTTIDLLEYFETVTPDSLQYVIDDLFREVTVYDNAVLNGTYSKQSDSEYLVTLEIDGKKHQLDSLGNDAIVSPVFDTGTP